MLLQCHVPASAPAPQCLCLGVIWVAIYITLVEEQLQIYCILADLCVRIVTSTIVQ